MTAAGGRDLPITADQWAAYAMARHREGRLDEAV